MKNKMLRYRVCELHMALVRAGEYGVAWYVLKILRKGKVKLYLDDDSWNAERALENAGCKIWYSHNGNTSEAYLHC